MPRPDSSRIKEIFSELADLDPGDRERYLDRACGDDAELRNQIENLLHAFEQTGGILGVSSIGEFLLAGRAAMQTLSEGEQVDRFRIIRLIGKGGMGEVYEADDPEYGRRVALKTLRPEFLTQPDFVARFRREIQVAWTVTHPNVCRIYDVGRYEARGTKSAFVTMELLTGESLAERLKGGALAADRALPIIRQIVHGLAALHEAHVIHRDLKPGNVVLVPCAEGLRCVITDFGLAHGPELPAGPAGITGAGQVLGTPAYMSPEQLTGKKVGPEADIYALGIVMYEMLCGRRPFDGEQFVESATQKLSRSPQPPSRVARLHPRWDPLILSCLECDIEKRPRTARQLLALLDQIGPPPGHITFRYRFRRPATYLAIAASVGAIAVPLSVPAVRAPVLRQLCRSLPGNAAVCALPVQKDIAVLPFAVKGSSDRGKALAAGLARYVREAFERLNPHPETVCVHLRNDRLADGVRLVLEGEVEATPDSIVLNLAVHEPRIEGSKSEPLTLRRVSLRVPLADAKQLHAEPVMKLARLLNIQYDERARLSWLKAAPNQSESFVAHLRGLGYLEQGKYEEAARVFDAAIDPTKDFAFAPAHVGLGDAYRLMLNKTGDAAWAVRARQAYRRAVALDRDFGFAGAEKHWGEMEAGVGNADAAIEHLRAALDFWPYDPNLQKALSAAYEAAAQSGRAEQVLREAENRAPHCWLTHNTVANFYSRRARFPEAEKELLEVVRLAPGNANAYHNLAFDYIKVGRFDDAIEMAARSIKLRPIPLAYSTLGRAYLYRGCPANALVNLRKAVAIEPDYFVLWANLAEGLYASAPDSERALAAYSRTVDLARQVLEKNPAETYARAQHALNEARLGRTQSALRDVDRELQQARDSHDVILLAAQTLEILGFRARALSELERALGNGLAIFETQACYGLSGLRRDPAYAAMLKRLHLNPAADPGGLTLPAKQTCPEPAVPGE